MNPGDVLALLGVVGGFVFLINPVARALAERLRAPRGSEAAALEALRDDVTTELRELRHEVAELQERVDFAERLLVKGQATSLPRAER